MKRKQFTFYSSYWEAIQPLPKKQQAEILLAICDYALNETEPDTNLSPTASVAFNLIRPTLDSGRIKAANRQNKTGIKQKQTKNKNESNAERTRNEKEGEKERE